MESAIKPTVAAEPKKTRDGFTIFRGADAKSLSETGCMSIEPFTAVQDAGMAKLVAAGYLSGTETRVLVNSPGFSLTHVWFRKGFPLPLHSHDADCLYYIVAGSLQLGTEELKPRDSFFIPENVPYTHKAGPDGVELLEFRTANAFNFVNLAKGEAFWAKAAETCVANRDAWRTAARPTLNA